MLSDVDIHRQRFKQKEIDKYEANECREKVSGVRFERVHTYPSYLHVGLVGTFTLVGTHAQLRPRGRRVRMCMFARTCVYT